MFTYNVYNRGKKVAIRLGERAQKQLRRIPKHVAIKLLTWIDAVESEGLENVRMIKGFHDEALKGKRAGQRSIRLSRAYRAIYRVQTDHKSHSVEILEVHKHAY